LDVLATTLHSPIEAQAQEASIRVMHPKTLEYIAPSIPVDSPVERLIRKLIVIFNLPEYHVKPGDTLAKIVTQEFHNTVTIEEMLAVNPGIYPDYIDKMVLKVPVSAEFFETKEKTNK